MSLLLDFPILVTSRLRLREIVATDASALLAIHQDAEHMRWFGSDPLADLAAAEDLIHCFADWRRQTNPGTRWGIQLRQSPTLIGSCGLFKWNRSWRSCTIGYEIAPDMQSCGYMQEALRAMLAWGFVAMELNRVEATIHPENTRSLRLVEALGFREEGRLRQAGFWQGSFHDMCQFGLLKSDWVALREREAA